MPKMSTLALWEGLRLGFAWKGAELYRADAPARDCIGCQHKLAKAWRDPGTNQRAIQVVISQIQLLEALGKRKGCGEGAIDAVAIQPQFLGQEKGGTWEGGRMRASEE